jgi:hypothetical protein
MLGLLNALLESANPDQNAINYSFISFASHYRTVTFLIKHMEMKIIENFLLVLGLQRNFKYKNQVVYISSPSEKFINITK